ncbi:MULTISPECIES: class F sortase [unclassified Streptomyces]|uniref:class F sortase n=1 Tax=unclassified Streptomyces TaxID=2593676 RepID=UPI0022B66D82|nr:MULTISPECIES: class F sortase [unclassified Streptomyces]MCZ7415389.1 class F sortase [Streptomyces sp. WMMC897]MCZ7432319.1 class F sortase [Streptomyces sp. WMMC1477]
MTRALSRWPRPGRRAGPAAAGVLAAVSVALVVAGLPRGTDGPQGMPAPPGPAQTVPAPDDPAETKGRRDGTTVAPMARSVPATLSVPSLGLSSPLEKLGRDADGAMRTPRDTDLAGWYEPGPTPGEQGPAVIAGHVTWDGEPSVFFRLGELRSGDDVLVERADGSTAEFTVTRVEQYAKDAFPTVEVYRNLDHAGLRLITCGGAYSREDNRYADNVVVYAELTGSGGP